MGFGIQNSAQGIHNLPAIGIWIQAPLRRNPESRVFNSESTTWNPQSKTILDYLTSVLQHRFSTSNISPPFNSPAANHSPFIPYKLVIAIYMPKGQGSIYLVLWRWRTFNVFKSSDLRRQPSGFTRCIAERILLCSGVVFFLRAKDLSFFYIQRWENPSVSQ